MSAQTAQVCDKSTSEGTRREVPGSTLTKNIRKKGALIDEVIIKVSTNINVYGAIYRCFQVKVAKMQTIHR